MNSEEILRKQLLSDLARLHRLILRYAAGEDEILVTHFEDAYRTMAMIEAGYASNDHGRTPIPE